MARALRPHGCDILRMPPPSQTPWRAGPKSPGALHTRRGFFLPHGCAVSANTDRYRKTPKGKAANKRYWQSAKGKATAARYRKTTKAKARDARYKRSAKGKVALANARARYMAKELQAR